MSNIKLNTKPIGHSGLERMGGRVYEEHLRKLKGKRGVKAYKEMRDNNAVVGALLFAIKMLTRQSDWYVEPAEEGKEAEAHAEFVEQCMEDMSHSWEDLISEILTMLPFGWAYFEIVYKYRKGPGKNPKTRSKYTDGKIGWRKIALRAQETLDRWEFDEDGGIAGMHQYTTRAGSAFIPIEKALLFRTETTKNNPEGRSVLRNAYRSWYFLRRIQEIEAIGIERDLAGLPVLQVPPKLLHPNASKEDKQVLADLQEIMAEVRRDEREGLVIPAEEDADGKKTGYKFELASTGGKRQFDTDKIIKRYESRIAMTVLMEFIMMGLEKGSYNAVTAKQSMFSLALDAWLDDIAAVFNRFAVPRLFEVNGIKADNPPKIKHTPVQQISLSELGEYVNYLARAGMPLFPDERLERELRQRANLPEPEESKDRM